MIDAGGEVELCRAGLPGGFVGGGVEEVAAEDEAIAVAADPCAFFADGYIGKEVVGGVGDVGSIFGVGAGEGDGGGCVFEDSVVGHVASEERGVVGDADLFSE